MKPTSALGSVKSPEELHSKSALDGNKPDIYKEANNTTKNMMEGTMKTRSFKSSRSRKSFANTQSHFNPLRFLAMGLIEKN